MKLANRLSTLCLCLLPPAVALLAPATRAGTPSLPAWQVLEYEQRAFWARAHSRLELAPDAEDSQIWQLQAESSVVNNSENVALTLAADDGSALRRTRLSKGKDQRIKTFEYGAEYILRERRNPGEDPAVKPEEWEVSNRRQIPYPVPRAEYVITGSYALLLLADRLQASDAESAEVVVHTDSNFYQVRMTCGNGIPIQVDYRSGDGELVQGRRETRAVALQVEPLGTPVDKPDFSLLGLHGEIILFFDRETGLPVQVRGEAPRIGPAEINLKAVTMREPSE